MQYHFTSAGRAGWSRDKPSEVPHPSTPFSLAESAYAAIYRSIVINIYNFSRVPPQVDAAEHPVATPSSKRAKNDMPTELESPTSSTKSPPSSGRSKLGKFANQAYNMRMVMCYACMF